MSSAAWVAAAYDRFVEQGAAGVQVVAIAAALDRSAGEFRTHFPDRRALLAAVVERWTREEAVEIELIVAAEADPVARVERLLQTAVAAAGERTGAMTIYRDARTEGVATLVQGMCDLRARRIADALVEHGVAPADARRRGMVAVATILGLHRLFFVDGAAPDRAATARLSRSTTEQALAC